jgi:hypothetical protein
MVVNRRLSSGFTGLLRQCYGGAKEAVRWGNGVGRDPNSQRRTPNLEGLKPVA